MRPLLALLLALTACGTSARPAAPPPAPEIDGTTAHAVARAALPRPAELPGFRRVQAAGDGDSDGNGVNAGTCLSHGQRRAITERSATYRRGGRMVTVAAAVRVLPTLDAVRADEAFYRDEFAECFERALSLELAILDVSIGRFSARRVRTVVRGADSVFAWEIRASGRLDGQPVTLRARAAVATKGHAELLVLGYGEPAGIPTMTRLASLLAGGVKRAAAAER